MPTPRERFRGSLLGAALGDIAGAPVEAESPAYVARTYRSVDDILNTTAVAEFQSPAWQVGRFTDDTQMSLCVADWLLHDDARSPDALLARLSAAHDPWRRYGPATESILRLYPHHRENWRHLATAAFPHGSYGNGSATRAHPIGLAFHRDPKTLASVAAASSRPTHSHPLAIQGAVLQATAVAVATRQDRFDAGEYLHALRTALTPFSDLLQDTAPYTRALDTIEQGLARNAPCLELSETLGTGVTAAEAVPTALYCFLRHPHSYPDALHHAVFLGGDTDTIASMAGALSGALLGEHAIPDRWIHAIREDVHNAPAIESLADQLHDKFAPIDG